MDTNELIEKARSIVKGRKNGDYWVGDVGAVLVTDKGNVYEGVCIDTPSSLGFCAEANAIGSMITAGESRITKIVAVWKNPENDSESRILAPCGRCREFIYQINKENIEAEVVLEGGKIVPLKELLPHYDNWGQH